MTRKYRKFILKNSDGKQLNVPIPLWFCPTTKTKIIAVGITESTFDLPADTYFDEPEGA